MCVSFADSLTLNLVKQLEPGEYNLALKLTDGQGLSHVTTVKAIVCNCDGSAKNCDRKAFLPAAIETSAILGILGGILALLSEYCTPLLLVTPGEPGQLLLRGHPQNYGLPSAWIRGPSQGLDFAPGWVKIALSHSWLLEAFASSEILADMFFRLSSHERRRVGLFCLCGHPWS